MPWKETSLMDQKLGFIHDYKEDIYAIKELAEHYGIARKTAYKWIDRYELAGGKGLHDRPRTPRNSPNRTSDELVEAILEARSKHQTWGPKKLLTLLGKRFPGSQLPARCTVATILKKHGLVRKRRSTQKRGHPGRPLTAMLAPNGIWTVDFKGQFLTRDGLYCYPLTIVDGFSRFLLACQGLVSVALLPSKEVFRRVFIEYGLPQIIRSDNGIPFASKALHRLTKLSVWWIKLGILPELIEPASPQQNARHERMHRTLKAETTLPRAGNLTAQQRRFNVFRHEYNDLRPHEALNMATPASCYQPSPRPFPKKLPVFDYPPHFEVRRVSRNGGIRWHSNWLNVGQILAEEYVAFEEVDNETWDVYFGPVRLGVMLEQELKIVDTYGRENRINVSPMSCD